AANLTDSYSDVPGSLVVNKSIAGPAAGRQGGIAIAMSCGGAALPELDVAAGAPAGTVSHVYPGIAVGATCSIDEVVDGHTDSTAVAVTGSGQSVTVPAGGTATVSITNAYVDLVGTLIVQKTILGAAAADHSRVSVRVRCDRETPELPAFVIGPGGA